MLGVFILHCTRFFDTEDWHLKAIASEQNEAWAITRSFFLWVWLMELFFLVSGFAAWYSLRRRSGGQYLLERVKRLLIPLYTVGMFILVVPQAYFDRLTHGKIVGTFWQWLPTFYRELPNEVFGLAPNAVLDPVVLVPYTFSGHLWFIQMLFVISLLTLPLLLYFKSERGLRLIDRLAGWSVHPGGIFLFVIPLVIVQVGLRWLPVTTDRTWVDFLWYALYFVIGYIIASDDRFTDSIKRHGWICLALWVVLFLGVGSLLTFVLNYDTSAKGPGFSALFVVWQITWSLISWSSVIFLLSLGAKYLSFTNKLLAYSNEAVLPFYLFHQTTILIVGWFVLPWDINSVAKFLIIAVVSFPLILILYEVFVRHIGFMRFLFGMTPKKKYSTAPGE
jgi:hypothetical protein